MSDIITCPNCGANSNNRKNCEYCGSLLVRLTRAGFDHSKLTNFEEANIYPGLQEALEKHKQESICKPEKCTITTIRDRAKESSSVSKAAKALFTQTVTTDPIQLVIVNSRQAKGDDGLYLFPKAENGDLTFIFDESDNTQDPAIISRFCDSELNNLFTLYNGLYFIDFGSDTKGAARLLSKLLYEVYKVPKLTNLQYDTTDVKDVKDYRSKRYKSLKILVTVSACIFTLICYLPKIYHTYSKHTKRLEERREYTDARENNYSYNSNTYEYTNAANNTPEEPVQPAMEIELASSSQTSSTQVNDDSQITTYKNGTLAIDMGLTVLWSDRNVGATSISDPGHLYSWGNSNWQDTDNKNKIIPSTDNISNSSYDIAKNELGDGWRMPTVDELKELKDNCNWELIEDSPISYYELTSKINGNKIRIYLAGYSHFVSGEEKNINKTGHIWAAEKFNKDNASNLSIVKNGKINISSYLAKGGISVRAVRNR